MEAPSQRAGKPLGNNIHIAPAMAIGMVHAGGRRIAVRKWSSMPAWHRHPAAGCRPTATPCRSLAIP